MNLAEVCDVLQKDGLLKEVIINDNWSFEMPKEYAELELKDVTYDSRQVKAGSFFFCKGLNFKKDYLDSAIQNGCLAYMTEQVIENLTDTQKKIPQIIVTDVQKGMALVGRFFYGNPQDELKVIGFTGTKGKSTSVYFCRHLLQESVGKKVAQTSSIDNLLDGVHPFEASLTTPESLDLFKMMRQAADNKMKYWIMEVSSQAYKKSRVYGLTFDVGVFLNISPDHISPVEHPTFEDYLYCKSKLIENAKTIVLNKELPVFDLLKQKAEKFGTKVVTFGSQETQADFAFAGQKHGHYTLEAGSLSGEYRIMIPGAFNYANASAALAAASQVTSLTKDQVKDAFLKTKVPGRMELFTNAQGIACCVDYAHNYLSLTESFKFAKHDYHGKLIVVIGAAGGKAESRRKDIGLCLSKYADTAILTSEDNFFEDPYHITAAIKEHITNDQVEVYEIADRTKAIKKAFDLAQPGDLIFLAGKGREKFMHEGGTNIDYEGDYDLALQNLGLDKNEVE